MPPLIEKTKTAYWNFLDNKLAKIKQQHKYAIWASCLLGLAALFLFPVYLPKNKEIGKLNQENVYLQGEIQKVEAIANKLGEHKAERAAVAATGRRTWVQASGCWSLRRFWRPRWKWSRR